MAATKSEMLSMNQLQQHYESEGFVTLPPLLSLQTCKRLNASLLNARADAFFDKTGFGFLGQNAFASLPAFYDALWENPIAEYACMLLKSEEVLLFQDLIIWKPPFSELPIHPPRTVEWHQDYSYWPLRRPSGITIWIALDDSTPDNGAVFYIPKSHRWGECQATLYSQNESYTDNSSLPVLSVEEQSKEPISCQAGSAIAHHPLCCHMSPVNQSERHRRAWSLTFLKPDAQWDPTHAPHPHK
ncbi:MAG: phytanoyl-CoA dioxygenase family protein [Myxococcota bacterium]|nr:phytanoyl-CoA dioxygenase family protein [Myxococcota bacterium]